MGRPVHIPGTALEQLAPDPFAAPARVPPGYAGDQLPHFGAPSGTAEPAVRSPAPEQLAPLTMPANYGVRPDENQMLTPIATEGADHDPE